MTAAEVDTSPFICHSTVKWFALLRHSNSASRSSRCEEDESRRGVRGPVLAAGSGKICR